jgi:hypothetical protein
VTIRTKRTLHAVLTSASMIGVLWTQAYATSGGGIFIEWRTLAFVFGIGAALNAGWGILLGGRNRRDD